MSLEAVHVPPLSLDAYAPIVGDEVVESVRQLAEPLRGARVLHLSSTKFGGGVAEMLPTLVALLVDLGIDARWQVLVGDPSFFRVTKSIHNGLQGQAVALTPAEMGAFRAAQERFAEALDPYVDFIVVHDPQPVGIRAHVKRGRARWIWRCHLDLTDSDPATWAFLRPEVDSYDAAIFTLPSYAPSDLSKPLIAVIHPSIDPLAPKNVLLEPHLADDVVYRFGVDPHRPLLAQISRFDRWKDPQGVIDVYRGVKRSIPEIQLALVGSLATDDPEGKRVHDEIVRYAGSDDDLHVLSNLDGVGPLEVNAFQRASDVVIQKSIREGFGLTVAEALWKSIPVVGGRVGGIPLQIGQDACGRLVDSVDGAIAACLELLEDATLRHTLGAAGRERVRGHFLSTSGVRDHLALMQALTTGDRALIPRGIAPDQEATGHRR